MMVRPRFTFLRSIINTQFPSNLDWTPTFLRREREHNVSTYSHRPAPLPPRHAVRGPKRDDRLVAAGPDKTPGREWGRGDQETSVLFQVCSLESVRVRLPLSSCPSRLFSSLFLRSSLLMPSTDYSPRRSSLRSNQALYVPSPPFSMLT
jgi:hypothetical protein